MPRPLEDATGLMIHGPLSLLKEPEVYMRTHRTLLTLKLPSDWSEGEGCPLTAELLILGRKKEGLWYDVKVVKAVGLLPPLDVFVETIFPGQLVRSEER